MLRVSCKVSEVIHFDQRLRCLHVVSLDPYNWLPYARENLSDWADSQADLSIPWT